MVIAIIGILSSVVLTSLNGARTKAKSSVYKEELTSLRPAIISACDSGTLATPGDMPSTASHPAGVIGTQSCGVSGAGTFSVTFGAATNGGACTGATMTADTLVFAGC